MHDHARPSTEGDAADGGGGAVGTDPGDTASEVEVEAVDSLDTDPAVDTPDYVLYGGKGGVGKTTMAAATALGSARAGTPTLVVSTDPAHSLSDAFETAIPADPARIRDDVPLWAVEIDPEAALAAADAFGADGSLSVPGLGDLGDLGGAGDGGLSMPGADEAAAMQQLLRYLDDGRFERVVVDTAPTGHTLRLLELPDVLDSMAGRLLQVRERLGGLLGSVPGVGDDADDSDDLAALRDRVERLRAVLRDPRTTDFRIVLVPETMSVSESRRLRERLDAFGVPVGTVVVNRVLEPPADVADVDPSAFVAPDTANCEFCRRRWEVQQRALAEAQSLFRGHDVLRVPLLAAEVRGDRLLRVVGACLR